MPRRSHPPTLSTTARRTLIEECGVGRGDRVLVAVSGGGDSQSLLHVLARSSKKLGFDLVAHGIDHGLRGDAGRELDLAEALAADCGVVFSRTRLRIQPGGNLQARAREARYAALRRTARSAGASVIATAHHADDRAETVLIRLLSGAGPQGLAVLPPRSETIVRPLVRARKNDVIAHLERHSIPYADDPSNVDRRFLRTRVRNDVLPLLENLSPGIVGHLTALADALAEGDPPVVVDEAGRAVELGRAHVQQIRRALRLGLSGARVRLSGGREVLVDGRTGRLELIKSKALSKGLERPRGGLGRRRP